MYIDVDEWVASHMDGDEVGDEVDIVIQSVEIKTDFKVDINMDSDMSPDMSGDVQTFRGETRHSLASIVEEDEDRMDVDPLVIEEQPEDTRELNDDTARGQTRPIAKRKKRWTDPEIHYVGALLDAGYKPAAIPDLFFDRYPEIPGITAGSAEYCRSQLLIQAKHAKESRLLGQELGLETGKWKKMDQLLKDETEAEKRSAIFREQMLELQATKGQHAQVSADVQAEIASDFSYIIRSRTEIHAKLQRMFTNQRQQWRTLLRKQYHQRFEAGITRCTVDEKRHVGGQVYLRQLTILVGQTRYNSTVPCRLPVKQERLLAEKLRNASCLDRGYGYDKEEGLLTWSSQILLEYDFAKLLLRQKKDTLSEREYQKQALDLLRFDEESLEILFKKLEERTIQEMVRQEELQACHDYQMKLMLLERQNKNNLQMALQGRDNLSKSTPLATQESSMQPRLGEQQINKKRPNQMMEDLDDIPIQRPPGRWPRLPSPNGMSAEQLQKSSQLPPETLSDMITKWHQQRAMQDQASGLVGSMPGGGQIRPPGLQGYSWQLMLLEQQNKKRLLLERQGRDNKLKQVIPPTPIHEPTDAFSHPPTRYPFSNADHLREQQKQEEYERYTEAFTRTDTYLTTTEYAPVTTYAPDTSFMPDTAYISVFENTMNMLPAQPTDFDFNNLEYINVDRSSSQESTLKTISPKDALLEYHDSDEDAARPLFPSQSANLRAAVPPYAEEWREYERAMAATTKSSSPEQSTPRSISPRDALLEYDETEEVAYGHDEPRYASVSPSPRTLPTLRSMAAFDMKSEEEGFGLPPFSMSYSKELLHSVGVFGGAARKNGNGGT